MDFNAQTRLMILFSARAAARSLWYLSSSTGDQTQPSEQWTVLTTGVLGIPSTFDS